MPVGHPLRRAGISDHHRCRAAGRSLAHDKTVRVEGRREKEEVRPPIPRADDIAVGDRTGEKAAVVQPQLFCIAADLRAVRALADEHHAEVDILLAQRFQRIQDDTDALVPHQPPDEEENRYVPRQIVPACRRSDGLVGHPSARHVHTVFHHDIVSLVAERAQIFPRSAAHDPDLVAARNILHQRTDSAPLQELTAYSLGDVNVIFCVIRQHERRVDHGAQGACQQARRNGTVCVHQIDLALCQHARRLGRERIARHIADESARINARIPQHGERKRAVVRAGHRRRHDDGVFAVLCDLLRIVHDGVCHAVDLRRKGIVQKADGLLVHAIALLYFLLFSRAEV